MEWERRWEWSREASDVFLTEGREGQRSDLKRRKQHLPEPWTAEALPISILDFAFSICGGAWQNKSPPMDGGPRVGEAKQ